MSTQPRTRCVLTIHAELDHTIAARILGLATVRGETPVYFSAQRSDESLRIVLELCETHSPVASLLAQRIRNLPSVMVLEASGLPAPLVEAQGA